jgi:hypothetical protein
LIRPMFMAHALLLTGACAIQAEFRKQAVELHFSDGLPNSTASASGRSRTFNDRRWRTKMKKGSPSRMTLFNSLAPTMTNLGTGRLSSQSANDPKSTFHYSASVSVNARTAFASFAPPLTDCSGASV